VTSPAKAKGDAAEREFAGILTDLLGLPVSRSLGAGRAQDRGDLYGIPDTVIQVANWADVSAAAIGKPALAELQRINADATFAATAVRFRGGVWRVVLTPDQYATYVRETLP
jgi:hypothetical protein